jgi:glutathione S-transferase
MSKLTLTVLSLRYSSWSMRPWLALQQAGARFDTKTIELPGMGQPTAPSLAERRALGSVRGLFPVLHVDGTPIHESLAICEYVAEAYPDAQLWPKDGLLRAEARAISCEMLSGFGDLRREMSCHLFGRVPALKPGPAACADIARVFEIWEEKLAHSGGPFLFGGFSIADAMFYPVLTRFRTYRVAVPAELAAYAEAIDSHPAVRALVERARLAPRIAHYDENLRGLGGDPDAALRSVG